MYETKKVSVVLAAVVIVGVLGIPLGDPKFISQVLVLETCFVVLAILSAKGYKHVYFPNFIIAGIVIAGNSAFSKHIEIMTTFHPLYNALVLIVGGYILQILLLITNYRAYKQYKYSIRGGTSHKKIS
ncbi:MAG TPA: hypothetical protein VJ771_03110 [Candidatus Nitrosotalea sp.]|nr:hypothetical protein [Candidatus Nitrosotalea sp.]